MSINNYMTNQDNIVRFVLYVLITLSSLYLLYKTYYKFQYTTQQSDSNIELQNDDSNDNNIFIQNKDEFEPDENIDTIDSAIDSAIEHYVVPKLRSHAYFDITINNLPIGRIIFELYDEIVPKTVKNFKVLCKTKYKGNRFHRIIKNFIIQSGDFEHENGTGGYSIYGKTFEDENFKIPHDKQGILSMANKGKDTNGSQFFITTSPTPELDGKHVAFGFVKDGFEVLDRLNETFTNKQTDNPIVDCVISECGIIEN